MKMKDIIVVSSTVAVFLILTMAAWLKPADAYSDSERRELEQAPALTVDSFLNGSFTENFESYAVDQFPMRDGFRQLKTLTAKYAFGQLDVHDIYVYDGYLSQMEYPLKEDSLARAAKVFRAIYDKYLAGREVKTYFSMIPDKNYFMAEESGHLSMDYDALHEYMKEQTGYMEYVDITELLELEDYYKTDTHWRQEKIQDVAKKLLQAMNIDSETSLVNGLNKGSDVEISEVFESDLNNNMDSNWDNNMPIHENIELIDWAYTEESLEEPFYGVYAGQSGLPIEGEELIYLDHENFKNCIVYNYEDNVETEIYDMEKAIGKDPYEMFLSGPISLLTIENPEATTEKELIMFRDSFGSSLAPLLVEGYAKITLVDIRYLSNALLENWITFDDQDVLFIYSTQVLNNSETMK